MSQGFKTPYIITFHQSGHIYNRLGVAVLLLLIAWVYFYHYADEISDYLERNLASNIEVKASLKSRRGKSPLKPRPSLEARDLEHVIIRKSVNLSFSFLVRHTDGFLHEPFVNQETFISNEELLYTSAYTGPFTSRSPPLFS